MFILSARRLVSMTMYYIGPSVWSQLSVGSETSHDEWDCIDLRQLKIKKKIKNARIHAMFEYQNITNYYYHQLVSIARETYLEILLFTHYYVGRNMILNPSRIGTPDVVILYNALPV